MIISVSRQRKWMSIDNWKFILNCQLEQKFSIYLSMCYHMRAMLFPFCRSLDNVSLISGMRLQYYVQTFCKECDHLLDKWANGLCGWGQEIEELLFLFPRQPTITISEALNRLINEPIYARHFDIWTVRIAKTELATSSAQPCSHGAEHSIWFTVSNLYWVVAICAALRAKVLGTYHPA